MLSVKLSFATYVSKSLKRAKPMIDLRTHLSQNSTRNKKKILIRFQKRIVEKESQFCPCNRAKGAQ